jgi:hypothetical protein
MKIVGLVDCAWTTTAKVINEVGMGGGDYIVSEEDGANFVEGI